MKERRKTERKKEGKKKEGRKERNKDTFIDTRGGGKSNNLRVAIPKLCELLNDTPHNTNHNQTNPQKIDMCSLWQVVKIPF